MAMTMRYKLTSPIICVPSVANTPRGCPKFNVICSTGTKNYRKVLSLGGNAGVDEIKKAYRNMALVYHPDVCDPSKKEESTRMFVELHEAYKTLIDQTSTVPCSLKSEKLMSMNYGDEAKRDYWRDQVAELSRRSREGKGGRDGSWGSRMRAQPIYA